ncbi:UNVERIFIED_CONTAM: hypothetical protein HDU68_005293 [Siphonaria sp. JEL0065]|nr:hypothetical protein HDU68_005293 [Siphonaria sp. JEL0065]
MEYHLVAAAHQFSSVNPSLARHYLRTSSFSELAVAQANTLKRLACCVCASLFVFGASSTSDAWTRKDKKMDKKKKKKKNKKGKAGKTTAMAAITMTTTGNEQHIQKGIWPRTIALALNKARSLAKADGSPDVLLNNVVYRCGSCGAKTIMKTSLAKDRNVAAAVHKPTRPNISVKSVSASVKSAPVKSILLTPTIPVASTAPAIVPPLSVPNPPPPQPPAAKTSKINRHTVESKSDKANKLKKLLQKTNKKKQEEASSGFNLNDFLL